MQVRAKGDNRAIVEVLLQHGPYPAISYPRLPWFKRIYRSWAQRGPALESIDVDRWISKVDSSDEHSTVGQGARHHHLLFGCDAQVGNLSTEIWPEDRVVLVHSIEIKPHLQCRGYGVAALAWLARQSTCMLVPVHVTRPSIEFWERMIVRNPRRISPIDLLGAEYHGELERRAADYMR